LIHRGFIGVSHYVGQRVRDEERPVERKKKLVRKRGQEPKKGIWTAVKDNAGLVAAIIGLFGVVITGAINTYIANQNQVAQRQLEDVNAQRQRELENERAQEAALQTYLTDIGRLILDDSSPLPEATAGDDVSKLARAKTLTVLLGLDGGRKRILLQFLKEEELINAPNSIVSLSGADLSYAQLSSVDKDHNRFFLEETDLAGANLFAAKMRFAYLLRADLSRTELTEADLSEAFLVQTDLSQAFLTQTDLREANLSGAVLSEAFLTQADLSRADLTNADLTKAALQGANLSGCPLDEATLTDALLQRANLSSASLRGADLSNAKLQGANLSPATVPGFPGLKIPTNLTDADLSDAALQGADLSSADLTDADLTGAEGINNEELEQQAVSLKGATMPNGQKYEDWLKSKNRAEDG
jgi:uncharacterized protein YjbI with pentapeptide repeats